MKKISLIMAAITLFIAVNAFKPNEGKATKAKIMVLGSYHMANPGADVFNIQADDVLAPKRQAEMEELVKAIAKFKPTKIAIEVGYQTKYDTLYLENYRKYLKGDYILKKNESEQVGFRLAKMMGHSQLYCIDETGPFDFNKLMQFAMQNGMGEKLQQDMKMVGDHISAENEKLKTSTLKEFLKQMNNPDEHSKGIDWYTQLLKIKKDKNYVGAELLADVYERNLKIMANLINIKESPEDRILVIYGNGHVPFFKNILTGSSDFEWVESYDYL